MVTATENVITDEVEQKITNQVEYYFGDLNLKQDKFMKAQMQENDGWVPIDKLMTFNRLKTLTTDQELVVSLLKKSTSGLVEVNEDGTKIRRIKPIPEESEEYIKELNQRTVHLKGFPKDSTLDDIMQFCSEFGKVESIQMRRNFKKNNEFKGCIMVTYPTKEDAEKVLNSADLKYKDIELLKEDKEKYFERKKNFYDSLKKKKGQNIAASGDEVVKTKGAILKITGLPKDTKFSDVKEELSKHSKVAFVSNVNDQSECHVRFADVDGAKAALKALKGQADPPAEEVKTEEGVESEEKPESDKVSLELFTHKVDISLPSEEEEKEFWREFQSKQHNFNSSNKKNKWQRGKKRFNHDNGRSNKRSRAD